MKLEAKARLQADDASEIKKRQLDQGIENKKKQVKQLKKSMPSRQNRMAVSPHQRQETQKRIHQTQTEESDLRLQKTKVGE